jgi:hypothetical protein
MPFMTSTLSVACHGPQGTPSSTVGKNTRGDLEAFHRSVEIPHTVGTETILRGKTREMRTDFGVTLQAPISIIKAWEYCKDKLENQRFFVA